MGEVGAFGRQLVQTRRPHDRMAIYAQAVGPVLISHNQKNVGMLV